MVYKFLKMKHSIGVNGVKEKPMEKVFSGSPMDCNIQGNGKMECRMVGELCLHKMEQIIQAGSIKACFWASMTAMEVKCRQKVTIQHTRTDN